MISNNDFDYDDVKMKEEVLIDLKEVAKLFKISLHTVRDYKKRGLITSADKKGNKDLFDKKIVIRQYRIITEKRRKGYNLSQIGSLFAKDLQGGT